MPSEMAAAPSTAMPLPPNGRLLTSSVSTTTGVVPFTAVSGRATNTVLPSRPCWVSPASSVSVSRSSTVTPAGSVGESAVPPSRRARPSWTSPSASMATMAPFDARSVVFTRSRRRRSWRRPTTVPSAARAFGQLLDERVELGADDLGAVLHVVARRS